MHDRRYAPIILLSLLLSACATTGAPLTRDLDATAIQDRLFVLAWSHVEERRYGEAAREFQELLKRDPENFEARRGLAEARLGSGDPEGARDLFRQLVEEKPEHVAAREGLGSALFLSDRPEEAAATLKTVIEQAPDRWRAWHVLAQVHDQQKDWPAADAAYAEALSRSPNKAAVHNNWGTSLMARERFDQALAQFERALKLDPQNTTARANLELAYAFLGRYDEVLAMSSSQDRPRVLNNLGYVAMHRGDLARAESYFARALDESPSFYPKVWHNIQHLERLKRAELTS